MCIVPQSALPQPQPELHTRAPQAAGALVQPQGASCPGKVTTRVYLHQVSAIAIFSVICTRTQCKKLFGFPENPSQKQFAFTQCK